MHKQVLSAREMEKINTAHILYRNIYKVSSKQLTVLYYTNREQEKNKLRYKCHANKLTCINACVHVIVSVWNQKINKQIN